MLPLHFPKYQFRFKNTENSTFIFDVIRKKFVKLQAEEWVRQHMVHYLIYTKHYPKSLVNVEKQIIINGLRKRYDIIVYNIDGSIHTLVECKAPQIAITQQTFDQIAIYNLDLKATYLIVTNGMAHFYCQMDHEFEKYSFLTEIPDFRR